MGLLSVPSEARSLVLFSFDSMYVGGWDGQDQLGLGARLRVSAFKTNVSPLLRPLLRTVVCKQNKVRTLEVSQLGSVLLCRKEPWGGEGEKIPHSN